MLDGQIALESLRPLSRAEYDRMVELGMFHDERIELLRGVLVKMSPIGWLHSKVVNWLASALNDQRDKDAVIILSQSPIAASDWSEPEPDVCVALADPARDDHPDKLLLVIEVADSSLHHDRTTKLALYAESRIPEYWIVNLKAMTVEVHTQPVGSAYMKVETLGNGDTLRPLLLPSIRIPISSIPR